MKKLCLRFTFLADHDPPAIRHEVCYLRREVRLQGHLAIAVAVVCRFCAQECSGELLAWCRWCLSRIVARSRLRTRDKGGRGEEDILVSARFRSHRYTTKTKVWSRKVVLRAARGLSSVRDFVSRENGNQGWVVQECVGQRWRNWD